MPLRTLLILRHAKSSWNDHDLDDHDRPLSARGRRAAPVMGRWLAGQGLRPDRVLCSDAVRTRQTWSRVAPELDGQPEVVVDSELYLAGARTLLERIRATPDPVGTLLVIGHNPGLHDLALMLAGEAHRPRARARLEAKLPTAGLVVLKSDLPRWATLERGGCTLVDFVIPRSLDS